MPIHVPPVDAVQYEKALNSQPDHFPREMKEKNADLFFIIKPIEQARYTVHSSFKDFFERINLLSLDYGNPLELNPDYQRGHVWTLEQKKAFVLAVLRGAVPDSGLVIQFNCPNWDNHDYQGDLPLGFQCVDGLQRVTAVTEFCEGKFDVNGLFCDDLKGSSYQIDRGRFSFLMQVFAFQSKKDLLAHYLAINSGGTPHSESELARVKSMMEGIEK